MASELLRGAKRRPVGPVKKLIDQLLPIEPPSWRRCWLETGRLLPAIFENHEEIGLARLQNDALLALTARHTGTVLVTSERHFTDLAAQIPFASLIV